MDSHQTFSDALEAALTRLPARAPTRDMSAAELLGELVETLNPHKHPRTRPGGQASRIPSAILSPSRSTCTRRQITWLSRQ